MSKIIDNRILKRVIALAVIVCTLALVCEKTELINHAHCEEENCPICEVAYVVNEVLKNVIINSLHSYISSGLFVILLIKILDDKLFYPKELSLVKCKVRLDD